MCPAKKVMKKNLYRIIFSIFCLAIFLPLLFAQPIILSGKQTKHGQRFSAKLESEPVELLSRAEITKVIGSKAGFWISKKTGYSTEVVYKFRNPYEAIGKTLEEGTYVAYPILPSGEQEAIVAINLELQRARKNNTSQDSAIIRYQEVMDKYFNKIPDSSGLQKERLCKSAIRGFQEVVEGYQRKGAQITQMLALYNQAQCYRVLGDRENYQYYLIEALHYIGDYQDFDQSSLGFLNSLNEQIIVELKKL